MCVCGWGGGWRVRREGIDCWVAGRSAMWKPPAIPGYLTSTWDCLMVGWVCTTPYLDGAFILDKVSKGSVI